MVLLLLKYEGSMNFWLIRFGSLMIPQKSGTAALSAQQQHPVQNPCFSA